MSTHSKKSMEALLETAKILIIEDDQDIRESVRILLEGEGFSVEEAANGVEGLNKISSDINLIILDIMMPGISGIKHVKKSENHHTYQFYY